MANAGDLLPLAATLERACRLASGLEGIMKERASRCPDVDSAEYTTWVLASELLYVLDEGRASLVLLKTEKVGHSAPLPPANPGQGQGQ